MKLKSNLHTKQDELNLKKNPVDDNPCALCRAFGKLPPCPGHGGGGGGDSGAGNEENKNFSDPNLSSNLSVTGETSILSQSDTQLSQPNNLPNQNSTYQDSRLFNPDVINYLLDIKALLITNNYDTGILTIKLSDPKLLNESQKLEVHKFVNAIMFEYELFKSQHQNSNSNMVIKKDSHNNFISLKITMPSHELYDSFIKQLQNMTGANQLTPEANVGSKMDTKFKLPTPFRTKPTPFKDQG